MARSISSALRTMASAFRVKRLGLLSSRWFYCWTSMAWISQPYHSPPKFSLFSCSFFFVKFIWLDGKPCSFFFCWCSVTGIPWFWLAWFTRFTFLPLVASTILNGLFLPRPRFCTHFSQSSRSSRNLSPEKGFFEKGEIIFSGEKPHRSSSKIQRESYWTWGISRTHPREQCKSVPCIACSVPTVKIHLSSASWTYFPRINLNILVWWPRRR